MCFFPNTKFRQIKLSVFSGTVARLLGIFLFVFPFKLEVICVHKLKASQTEICSLYCFCHL